ncbi:MAG: Rab family GTPase [Candidatus Helarchaeota archaeon]
MIQSNKYTFKVVVIGEPRVGKTSLIRRFADNTFSDTYKTTIGADFSIKVIELMNNKVFLTIWDIGAQERFSELRNYYYNGADAAILVYDVANPKTLDLLHHWNNDFTKSTSEDTPRIIVGNKIDLLDDESNRLHFKSAKKFCDDEGIELIFSSAKTNYNVYDIFKKISELCLKRYNIGLIISEI